MSRAIILGGLTRCGSFHLLKTFKPDCCCCFHALQSYRGCKVRTQRRTLINAIQEYSLMSTKAVSSGNELTELSAKRCKMAEDAAGSNGKASVHCNGDGAKTDEQLFDELFPVLIKDLIETGEADVETRDAFNWYRQVNEYNVPHGKRNRGLTVVNAYRYIIGDNVTDEGLKLACVIGWCIEWLQAYFLIADDIMDGSITRRGQPCWYKRPEVGMIAINDSFHLECAIYVLLRKYLRGKEYYVDILDLFHETTNQTVVGQTLDLITAPTDHVDFTNYTLERYQAIVKYKTAFYSFYLPVACAMYMAGIKDELLHSTAKRILLKMGEFFQIQDDYIDCYGDPSVTGKIGTDIEDNKCGWLIVQALIRASPAQRVILQENYARHDPAAVKRVRNIYADLNLESVYLAYEDESYAELTREIDQLTDSSLLPRGMFTAYASKIYKRQK